MKKRSVKVLLALLMVLAMVCVSACGNSGDKDKNTQNTEKEQNTEAETEQDAATSVSSSDAETYVFAATTEAGKELTLKMDVANGNQGNPDGTWELSENGSVVKKGSFETDTYMFANMTDEDSATVMGIFERTDSYDVTGMIFDTDYVKFGREGQELYDYGVVKFALDSFVVDGKEYDGASIQGSASGNAGQGESQEVKGTAYNATVQVSTPEYTGDLTITLTLDEENKTFTLKDKWGGTDVSGTYEIAYSVVLKLTTSDGTLYTGCIQMDDTYNPTGIIFDENYDNGHDMTWTNLLDFGAVTFTVVAE